MPPLLFANGDLCNPLRLEPPARPSSLWARPVSDWTFEGTFALSLNDSAFREKGFSLRLVALVMFFALMTLKVRGSIGGNFFSW